jgi:hypothetical protein
MAVPLLLLSYSSLFLYVPSYRRFPIVVIGVIKESRLGGEKRRIVVI